MSGGTGVRLARGSLHLSQEVYRRHFAGLESALLLRDGPDLLLLPLRDAAAGGLLLKVRNAAGDRVVDAVDFLRGCGVEPSGERHLEWSWDAGRAALLLPAALGSVRPGSAGCGDCGGP